MGRPLVIGHRGFAGRFPENSLEAVRQAVAIGADGLEIDVRPCLDGIWVCHHDRTRSGREVSGMRLFELRRDGVPTLEEVVRLIPAERWLFVEVKPLAASDLDRALAALLSPLRSRTTRTRIISSSLPVLGALQAALPDAAFSWVFGSLPEWLPSGFELSPKHGLVEQLLPAARPLHPWTVNRPDRMLVLAALGVASITTNHPDRAVEVLHG
ncbi:MAG: glycerophosphodiester phosphodiesterase [Acidobacteriota bacterium]